MRSLASLGMTHALSAARRREVLLEEIVQLADLFRLADRAGLLIDPERSARRMQYVLGLAGIG